MVICTAVAAQSLRWFKLGAIAVSHGPRNVLIPTSLDILDCTGNENNITSCNYTYGGIYSVCQNDAGIICHESMHKLHVKLFFILLQ